MFEDNDNSLVVFIDAQFDDVNTPGSCTVFFLIYFLYIVMILNFHDMMQAFTFSVFCLWTLTLHQGFQFEMWLSCERLSVSVLHHAFAGWRGYSEVSVADSGTKKTRKRLQLLFERAERLSTKRWIFLLLQLLNWTWEAILTDASTDHR